MSEKKRSYGDVFEDTDGDLAFQSKVGPVKLTFGADPNLKPYQAAEKTLREVSDRMAQVQRERLDYLAAKMPKAQLDETQPTLRITSTTAVNTPSGAIKVHASPDLKPGECILTQQPLTPADPIDVHYDGVSLRDLLDYDTDRQREVLMWHESQGFTPAQRAAVSAHWSAELRNKIAAVKERDRNQVTMEHEE